MNKKIVQIILKWSTALSLKRNKYKIVAITGSAGKTSTKKAVTLVLKKKYRVLSFEEEGYNTEIGLPLMLFERKIPKNKFSWLILAVCSPFFALKKRRYDYCVLEMGADRPGDIEYFMNFIKPDISIVTNIYPVHIEEFGTVESIAAEKAKIFGRLGKGDVAIINSDDKFVEKMTIPNDAKKVSFGNGANDIKILKQVIEKSGSINYFKVSDKEIKIESKTMGEHLLYIFGAAIAVGISQGISREDIKAALEAFEPVRGRLNIIKGVNGSIIIDDSYNASPESMKNALDILSIIEGSRKIAALGSMNELGIYEKKGHEEAGVYLVGKCDILLTVGELAQKYIAPSAIKGGFDKRKIFSFKTSKEAGDYLRGIIKSGDVVLAKGSQNKIRMEKMVKAVMRNPEDAPRLLCRQGKEWENK